MKAGGIEGGETGSVTFVQRFNSTLGNFVHLHVVALDGVFVRERDGESLAFHEGPAPSRQEIATVAERVEEHMTRWLRRRGFLDERPAEDRSNEAHDPTPLEACMQMSLFGGVFLRLTADGTSRPPVGQFSSFSPIGVREPCEPHGITVCGVPPGYTVPSVPV